ncbi:hypothetical protein [Paenibacillus popilliae]|uniref:Membrane carboxypeptidase n=1 Tax=Paenibacillus popilliae ATCC 14706 TaxID=1212764 RepID=M9M5K3_PAEPP|nr:hypothetical protein [Paenibacillus popilliae]GAC44419.1 membrane carboxypeptidase [Paenibacillus popilliae ATCC 14706]
MTWKATKFRRPVEIDGRLCAEIGMIPADENATPVLAYIAPVRNGGYELVRAVQSDADDKTDGYDNPMHTASEEFAAEDFGTDTLGAAVNGKELLLDAALGSAEVRDAVDHLFQME